MTDLQCDEPGLVGVRRIFQEWVADASGALGKKRITDANIHDARKQLKRSRAAIRLLRDAIGDIAYRRDNAALRDAARALSVARDSKVIMAALDDLVEREPVRTRSLQLDQFRGVLRKEQTEARHAITRTLANKQRRVFREVIAHSERWRIQNDDWSIIGAGLERIYRNGKKKMRVAAQSRVAEDLHEWRKQVKYLWHQLQILKPLWPGPLGELASQAHRLAEHLGDDHDLAVLRQKIALNAPAFENQHRDALIALLDRRRDQLQLKAFALGARIYEEKPSRFRARMGQYWRTFRK